MPAGDGVYQVIGWIFEAEDLSSDVVTKAEQVTARAAAGMETTFDSLSTKAEDVANVAGGSFSAFSEQLVLASDEALGSLTTLVGSGINALTDSAANAYQETFGGSTLRRMFEGIVSGAEASADAVKRLGGAAFDKLKSGASSAAVATKDLFGVALELGKSGFGGLAKLGKSGFLTMFTGPLGLILKLLQPIIKAVTDALSPAIETLSAAVSNAFAPLASLFETMAQQLAPMIQKLLTPFVALISQAAITIMGPLMDALSGATGAMGPLAEVFQSLMGVLPKLMDAFVGLAKKVFPVVIRMVNMLLPIVGQIITLMADTLAEQLMVIGDLVAEIGPPLVDAFSSLLKAIMPLLPPLLKLGVALLKNVFAPLVLKSLEGWVMIINDLLVPAIEFLVDLLVPFINRVIKDLGNLGANLSYLWTDVIKPFFEPVMQAIEDVITAIFVGFSPSLMDAISAIGEVFETIVAPVTAAVEGIVSVVTEIPKTILGIVETIGGVITAAFNTWAKLVGDVVDKIAVPVLRMVEKIVDAVIAIPDKVLEIIKTVVGAVKDFAKVLPKAIDAGIALIKRAVDAYVNLWRTYWNFLLNLPTHLGTIWEKVKTGVSTAFKFITDKIGGAFTWIKEQLAAVVKWATTKLTSFGTAIIEALGLQGAVERIRGGFGAVIRAVTSPVDTIKGFMNEHVRGTVNPILAWEVPVIGNTLSEVLGWGNWRMPRLAAGGIATGDQGVVAEIGEAGVPELVQPLTPESVRQNLLPVLADIGMPGLEEAVGLLDGINRALGGTLKVMDVNGGDRQGPAGARDERATEDSDLAASPGLMGMVPTW